MITAVAGFAYGCVQAGWRSQVLEVHLRFRYWAVARTDGLVVAQLFADLFVGMARVADVVLLLRFWPLAAQWLDFRVILYYNAVDGASANHLWQHAFVGAVQAYVSERHVGQILLCSGVEGILLQ